jgi:photosystem II stability/assembly factor-like uncharacterized protein
MQIIRNFLIACIFAILFNACDNPASLDSNRPNWSALVTGSPLDTVFITDIASTDNFLFVTTRDGGVFRSIDFEGEWSAINDNLTTNYVYAIAIYEDNIFIGTRDRVFHSVDQGTSWIHRTDGLPPSGTYIYNIAIVSNHIFVSTGSYAMYRSTDNSITWEKANKGMPFQPAFFLAVIGPNVFAGVRENGEEQSGVFISSDYGANWSPTHNLISGKRIGSLGTQGQRLFVGTYSDGLFTSTDNGSSWNEIDCILTDKNVMEILAIDNNLYVGTDNGVYFSYDNGNSWIQYGLADVAIEELAVNSTHLFAASSSGIWKTKL